jgi:hypothetical protein
MNGAPSLRAADARLLAPVPVRRAHLLGAPEWWAHALDAARIEVTEENPDLVVATPRHANSASRLGAPAVLLLGSHRRELSRAGYLTRTFLVRRGAAGPRLFVPVDARNAVAHALLSPLPGRSAAKRLAIRVTLRGLRSGLPLGGAITLGMRSSQPPRVVTEALGATTSSDWYLLTGEGDDLQRLVWFCFDEGAEPTWVIKCSRVPGNDAPFVRDAQALETLDVVLPDELRRHAPRLTARLEVDGLPVAVETAAPGQPLHVLLEHRTTEPARVVGLIADWIVDLAAATELPPDGLAAEVARLAAINADVAGVLPPLPAVLQHNDLGCWNVLVRGEDFTVVDWESSRRAGLPLWDLVYFLTDALTAGPDAGKEDRVVALLRGELDVSQVLFTRLRSAAERMGIPLEAVGPIVTLAWLHHGRSARQRELVGAEHAAETRRSSAAGPLQQVARYWLADPMLGSRWRAFDG